MENNEIVIKQNANKEKQKIVEKKENKTPSAFHGKATLFQHE